MSRGKYRLPPLPTLVAFESAARHLSFKKAAEDVNVTPSAISQHVKFLHIDKEKPVDKQACQITARLAD